MNCRLCHHHNTVLFLSLGKTPLANNFLSKEELNKEEPSFPLELYFCPACSLVQLGYVAPPHMMFSHYLYVTSTSRTFREHFTKMAEDIATDFTLGKNSLVVDIGSNDGLLLKGFKRFGSTVVGIEPALNIAELANKGGIETINAFFDEQTVKGILTRHDKADVVTATNVFAHIPDINEVTNNVKALLKDSGIFVIEVQYLMDTVQATTFDNMYHEHLYYYSLTSLKNLFKRHAMEIFDVKHVDSHGGSLRVFIQNKSGSYKIKESVPKLLENEEKIGVNDIAFYHNFSQRVLDVKKMLVEHIKALKRQGKHIVGYGAPAKSTTLLNFCGITSREIDYIVEDNPLKIGRYSPGTHIPIVSSTSLEKGAPDYILILAWNFADEIIEKAKKHCSKDVKFITPLPEPRII
jgi:SAM-dependent methyltransferase